MRSEMGYLARDWWCRGGGAAVLAPMAVVFVFRKPSDPIFWAAAAFLMAHTTISIRRYLRARRVRTTATVIGHHRGALPPPPPPFPRPATAARNARLALQAKNTF